MIALKVAESFWELVINVIDLEMRMRNIKGNYQIKTKNFENTRDLNKNLVLQLNNI